MLLNSFSVENFRSITATHTVVLSKLTVLIGKNNEGKSNILRALETAMTLLRRHAVGRPAVRDYYVAETPYKWRRDFPIQLQDKRGSKQTSFRLEFSLTGDEVIEFKREIGVGLNGRLPLEIVVEKEGSPEFKILKTGRGTKTLTAKSALVAKFVAKRIQFNYIPAIRTERETTELIREMLASELRPLEEVPEYLDALRVIGKLQDEALNAIAARIEEPLREFLPTVKSVKLKIPEEERRVMLRRNVQIVIDDGNPTELEYKGEGVKSLAALGLLKDARIKKGGASILAIEEPESHLHPSAIHQVNEIVQAISKDHQVLVTTHNALFVDRENIGSNVIVSNGGARPAASIKAIRDVLGIRASDNLLHANYALVVEGQEDVESLKGLLPAFSPKLGAALSHNMLVIEPIGGAGNLSYKLTLLRNALCSVHVLLDYDDAGREAFRRAEDDGILKLAEVTFAMCDGFQSSEFEDLVETSIYATEVKAEFGVDINIPAFRGNKKWSERIRAVFSAHSKPCSDATLSKVKRLVATQVQRNPQKALHSYKKKSFEALQKALEELVKS